MAVKLRALLNNYKPSWFLKFKYYLLKNRKVNICNFYDFVAKTFSKRTAIILSEGELPYSFTGKKTISHEELLQFIGRLSTVFLSEGIGKGDRVVIYLRNRVEIFLTILSIFRIGAVAIPVNPLFKKNELEFIVQDSNAKAIVTDKGSIEYIGGREKIPSSLRIFLYDMEAEGCVNLEKSLEKSSPSPAYPLDLKKEGNLPVAILYTSGTTGFPKGAVMSARALSYVVKRAMRIGVFIPHLRDSLGINAQPLSHIMGIDMMLLACIGGITQLFVPRFEAGKVLDLIERERVTHFVGVPAMYKMMYREEPERRNLKSVLIYGSAADYIPPDILEKFREISKKKIFGFIPMKPFAVEEYGQVETAGFIAFRISIPFVRYDRANLFIRAPHVKIKIFDENGKPLRFWHIGRIGEICVKGKTIMEGYAIGGTLSKENFYGDWLRTGDLAEKRFIGFRLVGREKDRMKVGGYSVFPAEVEMELRKHPDVEDAVVFSIPHEIKGELPLAAVKLKKGRNSSEEEILQWVKENIAPYKAPRRIFIVEDFPRNLTLKVLRRELREKFKNVSAEI